jgi:hypothetical protein
VAEHRRSADQRTDEGSLQLGSHQRRHEPLGDVEQDDGRAERRPEAAPDVRGADVAAAVGADVLPPKQQDEPVPEWEAAGQVAGEDEKEFRYLGLIWYLDTQSFTAAQSMLSKNASM